MTEYKGKSIEGTLADIKNLITALVGRNIISNVTITDKNSNTYKVISGELIESGIEINKGMVSEELQHDVVIPYIDIKKIVNRVNNNIIFEDLEK